MQSVWGGHDKCEKLKSQMRISKSGGLFGKRGLLLLVGLDYLGFTWVSPFPAGEGMGLEVSCQLSKTQEVLGVLGHCIPGGVSVVWGLCVGDGPSRRGNISQ